MTVVRDALPEDIDGVVSVHIAAFGTFFLTSLGPRFLGLLYAGYLVHPSGILLVACEGLSGSSQITGFVAGTTEPPVFYSWLRRSRGIALALAAAPALLRRPVTVGRRLVSSIFYRGESPPGVESAALLASLAVNPASNGLGLGGMLVDAFVFRARERQRETTYLSTDLHQNVRVLQFYRRHGFRERAMVRRAGGREMAILIRDMSDGLNESSWAEG